MQKITLIAAVHYGTNAIGFQDKLPWKQRISEDFQHFKRETLDKPCIVGYNTMQGLPPLARRDLHVLGRGRFAVMNLLDQLAYEPEVMVIGGQKTYERLLPRATHMILTRVKREIYGADTFFPEFNWLDWNTVEYRQGTEPGITFFYLERIGNETR